MVFIDVRILWLVAVCLTGIFDLVFEIKQYERFEDHEAMLKYRRQIC